MTTRTERQFLRIMNERLALRRRIAKAEREHKSAKDLQARLVNATAKQIKTELRLDKKGA